MQLDLPGARVERSSDGQAFLFEERFGFVYLLDEIGALVVERMLREDITLDALTALVEEVCEIPPESDVKGDLVTFLQHLREYGLLL